MCYQEIMCIYTSAKQEAETGIQRALQENLTLEKHTR